VNLRRFLQDYTKFGVTIVEWSTFNANVLDFRYIFALSNYGANCLRLGMKNGANFGVFGPVRFRGHFEEIGIAKVNAICLRHFLVNCGILADRFWRILMPKSHFYDISAIFLQISKIMVRLKSANFSASDGLCKINF